jgi:hypothetical protein
MSHNRLPAWWNFWRELGPWLALAADGRYRRDDALYQRLAATGFDVARLRAWQPSEAEGRRLKIVLSTVDGCLRRPPANSPENRSRLDGCLPPSARGIWGDLRQLALAYLDGQAAVQDGARPVAVAPAPVAQPVSRQRLDARGLTRRLLGQVDPGAMLRFSPGRMAETMADCDALTVYLDETWVGETAGGARDQGVIAGLVCRGRPDQLADLPPIATHCYQKAGRATAALEALWAARSCFPVILPLRLGDTDEPASRHYALLLYSAIRFLLGWLLPRPGRLVEVYLFPEAMEQCGFGVGIDRADYLRGLLAADPGRFDQWDVRCLRWEEKDFGYIPYADLVGYLTLEHTRYSRSLSQWAAVRQLPGYVPFSLELVPRLQRLEHLETAGNLHDVIDLVLETSGTRFGALVTEDLSRRIAARPALQVALLEALEARYRDPVRDLGRLRRAFASVRALLPGLPEGASPRMRLLWYLLAFQDANHDGDPDRMSEAAARYRQERERLMRASRELCAHADLNLAIHYADRFEFQRAEAVVGEWVSDPLFAALATHLQGRMFSALGQSLGMQGESDLAETLFARAVTAFREAPLAAAERASELEKSGIFRAVNALEGGLAQARGLAEAVLGPLDAALGRRLAGDDSLAHQYRHHLFLHAALELADCAAARDAYLADFGRWRPGHAQHPWPSIHGHRGFLLWNLGDESAAVIRAALGAFKTALALAALPVHGPTVRLIGGLWGTVAACCFAGQGFEERAGGLLREARSVPGARGAITTLEAILADPSERHIPAALGALPFYYR